MASFFFRTWFKRLLLCMLSLCSSGSIFGMTSDSKSAHEATSETAAQLRLSSKSPFDPTTLKNGALVRFNKIHACLKHMNERGNECLNDVAAYGNLPLVMLLVDDFKVDAAKMDDCSALCHAITHFDVEKQHYDICKFLLDQLDVDAKRFCIRNGVSHDDQQHTVFDVVRYCDLKTLKLFIDRGADVATRDNDGNTLLHAAAQFNKNDIAEWLLKEHEFNVDIENNNGVTPLYVASEHGSEEVVETLLVYEADVNKKIKGIDNSTALHVAGLAGHPGIIELLTGAGADVTAQDDRGEIPLSDALALVNEHEYPHHGDPEVLERLCTEACEDRVLEKCLKHYSVDPHVVVGWIRYLRQKIRTLDASKTPREVTIT